ncbi:SPASM domain-containing protein, partial [Candidatus Micrarchaeota archaeon]|nr:SPASM domain-containing protein [Candidatus Micrarchaeota archaeon]
CMLKCPLCPTGNRRKGREWGKMKFTDFKKVMDEMAPWLYEINLNNWGEPFLNKDMIKMAEYAHGKRVWTSINSNMNVPLSERDAERLVQSGLDWLYVSFDGITQEAYEKYRRNGNLKTVFDNLKLVHRKKKELNSKKPAVVWQFLRMKHNEHEVPELERVKKELGIDELVVGAVRCDLGNEIFVTDREKVDSMAQWLPSDDRNSRYDYEKKERRVQKEFCPFLWFVTVVNWDGSVSPCCAIYEKKYDFGNAFTGNLKEIWNNEKYIASRDMVARRPAKQSTVCANCLKTGFID